MSLTDKTVAILLAPRGTEDSEFLTPKKSLESAGVKVVVVGLERGEGETFRNDLDPVSKYPVQTIVSEVSPDDFDLLIVPGGTVGSDKFRSEAAVIALANAFGEAGKPVAAICHAPWLLIEAGLVEGRRLTSFKSLRTDLKNAGGIWVDSAVVEDDRIITSRGPDDLPDFVDAILRALAKQ